MIVGHFQEKVGKRRKGLSESLINQFSIKISMIKVVTIKPPKQNNF